jgi:hypothetical protein
MKARKWAVLRIGGEEPFVMLDAFHPVREDFAERCR